MHTINQVRVERASGQVVRIELDMNADPNMTVSQLFGNGPIEVLVMHSLEDKTRLLFTTPLSLSVTPVELNCENPENDRIV